MKLLKSIISVPIALTIAASLFYFSLDWIVKYPIETNGDFVIVCLMRFFLMLMSCGLFPFLSALFASEPKKYSAVTSVVLSYILLSITFYFLIFVNLNTISLIGICSIAGVLAGLNLGFFFSCKYFETKGWNTKEAVTESIEQY